MASARTEADVLGAAAIRRWQLQHPNFGFLRTLTRAPGPLPLGRLPALLPGLFKSLGDYSVFIAGPPGFVDDRAATVDALGTTPLQLHTEAFFTEVRPW